MPEPVSDVAAFANLVDLAASPLGGEVLWASDDFFAEKENLLNPAPAVFIAGKYTDRGKWMDGWESRRKRVPGHDICIVKLGASGTVGGVDIDTHHFLGNHAPFASLEGVSAPGATVGELREQAVWTSILAPVPLRRGSHNLFAIPATASFTHVRLRIYPDGGVARLRVYGTPDRAHGGELDLLALANGGQALWCTDMFFSPMNNLLLPGEPADMGGGWETRRSRPPGADAVILRLGSPGVLDRLVIETRHFKGNYPDRAAVDGICWPDAPAPALLASPDWTEILAPKKLRADDSASFALGASGPWTHLRLRILPDGGVSRLRAWGTARPLSTPDDALLQTLNQLDADALRLALHRCCGSRRWVEALAAARPFVSRAHLFGLADWLWWQLDDADWKEAFEHHPRIGADVESLRAKFNTTAQWASAEQAGVASASEDVLHRLAAGNRAYEARFGYLFIVCATGRTALSMLEMLEERLGNAPEAEIRIAAGEQGRITRLRLGKLE